MVLTLSVKLSSARVMSERGVEVDRTTIYRWIQKYAPESEMRLRWHSKKLGLRWRVDETFIKVKGQRKYLYRAVDEHGDTIDFMLAHKRDIKTAKRFFKKALGRTEGLPCEINTDRLAIYKPALAILKEEGILPKLLIHTQDKLINNVIESDHRYIKRRVRPMLWFKSFHTAPIMYQRVRSHGYDLETANYFFTENF